MTAMNKEDIVEVEMFVPGTNFVMLQKIEVPWWTIQRTEYRMDHPDRVQVWCDSGETFFIKQYPPLHQQSIMLRCMERREKVGGIIRMPTIAPNSNAISGYTAPELHDQVVTESVTDPEDREEYTASEKPQQEE